MQEFKAKAKTTQKMTRDGVVETNQATGEQTRKSQRETEDFSGDTAEFPGVLFNLSHLICHFFYYFKKITGIRTI